MEIKVKCQYLDATGKGIFKVHGKEYSCVNLLPNETAWVIIDKNKAEVKQIVEASPQRRKQECPQFERCGGCQFQHASSHLQSQFKMSQLQSLFTNQRIEPILTMMDTRHYRHKVIATFSLTKNKKINAGIYEEDSHTVCSLSNCLIQHQKANEIIATIVSLANAMHYTVFDEKKRSGLLRHCLIRVSHAKQEVLVCLVVGTTVFPGSRNFVNELCKRHPEVKTVVMNVNSRSTSVVLGNEEKVLFGNGMIQDRLCGLNFNISAKTFYQINPSQTEVLYTEALKLADLKKEECVLDAYCGIGTISLLAAKKCKQVIGVEINPASIRNAISNAKSNNIKNVRFYAMDCGEFMLQAAKDKVSVDCVIMDPAREGSDRNFLKSLLKLAPKRVVYISCNSITQRRDIDFLVKGGYKIEVIQPVDLFPETFHVETVAMLSYK